VSPSDETGSAEPDTDGAVATEEATESSRPDLPRPLVVVAIAVGVVVLLLAAVAVWRTVAADDDATVEGQEAAASLVEAYTRHLDATFRVEGEMTRTLADGRTLSSAYLTVQRPPDRIQRSLGSTTGVVGGRRVNCSTVEGGSYACGASGPAVDTDEERRTTLGALESYVFGDDPLYSVTTDGDGCFDLVRRRTVIEATYGRRARLCFDEATWAIRRLEVEREALATDVLLAELITTNVTDADFDLGEDDTYDPEVPDEPDGSGTTVSTTP
jgi:hypothetical protein